MRARYYVAKKETWVLMFVMCFADKNLFSRLTGRVCGDRSSEWRPITQSERRDGFETDTPSCGGGSYSFTTHQERSTWWWNQGMSCLITGTLPKEDREKKFRCCGCRNKLNLICFLLPLPLSNFCSEKKWGFVRFSNRNTQPLFPLLSFRDFYLS